jgi:branched-chain amino acid transport system ATP-binding protein
MSTLLQLSGVRKAFRGLVAIKGLDFEISSGVIAGLIGPNGAGKTTAFNLISGTTRPSAGEIRFKGVRMNNRPPHDSVRMGLARTFQATTIFPEATVVENAMRGAFVRTPTRLLAALSRSASYRHAQAAAREKVDRILDRVGLSAKTNVLAHSLPYGHQRLLGIAIALASEPVLLLLDEPAAGLNPVEAELIGRIVRQIRDDLKISVLIVEHNMRLVMGLCDRIVVLNHGEKIAEGSPGEVRQNPHVIKAYLGATDDALA